VAPALITSAPFAPTAGDQRKDQASWRWRAALATLGLLLVGTALAIYYLKVNRPLEQAEGIKVKSLAVLPFQFIGSKKEEEYLGPGLADALITKLGNLRQVVVRPTTAVSKYRAEEQDAAAIGRELRVEAVLTGRVQKFGGQFRVSLQMVRVADGMVIWGGNFAEQDSDFHGLQDKMGEQVARALVEHLTGDERQQIAKRCTENAEACLAYTKGRTLYQTRTEEGFKKGIEYLELAVEKDPNYALAYVGLAQCYILMVDQSFLPIEALHREAKPAAEKALAIDNTLADAHLTLALLKLVVDWDWAGAEREHKRAIDLNPNLSTAHSWYSILLIAMGRFDEGLRELHRGQELDPVSFYTFTLSGPNLYLAGQYDQAIEFCREIIQMNSNLVSPHLFLGQAYEQKGMYQEAITELRKAVALSGDRAETKAGLAHAYAKSGNREEAVRLLNELKDLAQRDSKDSYLVAVAYAGLGEREETLMWLQKALAERHPMMLTRLKVDPSFAWLRSDPRFIDLLRRIGLEH
jgi:TolB-like protein/tetratricopeptide (TPR) repeat protein